MDIQRAFKVMLEDPNWVTKLGLAFVFQVLVVTSPAVIGYYMQYMRNVSQGQDAPLPEWNDFGGYWIRGFIAGLAALAYVIVGLLLLIIGIIPAMILFQAAVVEYAMTQQAGSLFSVGTIWKRIMAHSEFWTAFAVSVALGFVTSMVTNPLTGADSAVVRIVGGLLASALAVYAGIVTGNLYGQYARGAFGVAPAAAPAAPPMSPAPPAPPTMPE